MAKDLGGGGGGECGGVGSVGGQGGPSCISWIPRAGEPGVTL